jgi:hypothetical protein
VRLAQRMRGLLLSFLHAGGSCCGDDGCMLPSNIVCVLHESSVVV